MCERWKVLKHWTKWNKKSIFNLFFSFWCGTWKYFNSLCIEYATWQNLILFHMRSLLLYIYIYIYILIWFDWKLAFIENPKIKIKKIKPMIFCNRWNIKWYKKKAIKGICIPREGLNPPFPLLNYILKNS